jgi:N-acyl-D-aspartate/D-glutamate deacylase
VTRLCSTSALCVALFVLGCKPGSKPAADQAPPDTKTPAPAAEAPTVEGLDLVIANGRVMDPETNLDAIRNVGVKDGKIVVISEDSLEGARKIDATGHVVAPGFIDYHSHAQSPFGMKVYARDGVTTPMDLELGAFPVNDFYDYWEDTGALVNYGTSVSHAFVRVAVLDKVDPKGRAIYTGALGAAMKDGAQFKTKVYDADDEPAILAAVEQGLKQGGIGISYPIGYYTIASSPEVMNVAALAHEYGVPITSHVRFLAQIPPSGYLGMEEMLTVAELQDVPLLLHHIPSNCLGLTEKCLDLIDAARGKGTNVIGEFYPYTFAGTYVDADYLKPGYKERLGIEASDLVVTATGEKLTDEKFDQLRTKAPGTGLLMYSMKEQYVEAAMKRPGIIVGSDGMPWLFNDGYGGDYDTPYGSGKGHPRGAGTHAMILRLVREKQTIPLMDAVARMSYLPAKFLGPMVPQMQTRGRLQEGMTADITIFDPDTVTDNASFEDGKNTLPSTGIPYVIVNGTIVVDDSKVQKVSAGVAIRNKIVN